MSTAVCTRVINSYFILLCSGVVKSYCIFIVCFSSRLRNRVLSVRNMFLRDRIHAMEREMEMMRPMPHMPEPLPVRPPVPRRAPEMREPRPHGNPLLRALLSPRSQ